MSVSLGVSLAGWSSDVSLGLGSELGALCSGLVMMMLLGASGAWSWSERVRWLSRSRRFVVTASVVGWRWLGLADAIVVVGST